VLIIVLDQNASTPDHDATTLWSLKSAYLARVPVRFQKKDGWIMLDQMRAVDKRRLIRKLG
jgi:mRNA-degrading endonuclease toxin of MazEF toxin-antitoxin module